MTEFEYVINNLIGKMKLARELSDMKLAADKELIERFGDDAAREVFKLEINP